MPIALPFNNPKLLLLLRDLVYLEPCTMVWNLLSMVELMEQWLTNNFWIGCTDAALHNSAYRQSAKGRQSEAGE